MKRTQKIIILLIITTILSYIIYNNLLNKKINYITLGNKIDTKYKYYDYINNYLIVNNQLNYFNNYYIDDYKVDDLIRIIKENTYELIDGHHITIQQLFRKCSLLTIYLHIDSVANVDNLIHLLTYYTDCPLYIIIDKKEIEKDIASIANKYKVNYIFAPDIIDSKTVGETIINNLK